MSYIRSIAIWVFCVLLTALLFFVDLFFTIILFPFDKQRKVVHAQCYWWADALSLVNPYWDLRVSGLENIDHNKTYVIIANHQSMADIIVLYKIRTQFKWVAKESLFSVPFLGWCLSLGKHIKLERGKLASIKNVYRDASKWLKQDMSVLMFPEGTRSETGNLGTFQNGAFKLAIKEKRAILPISIDGTWEAIPKGGWVFKTKVPGVVKVLPPIETKDMTTSDFNTLRDTVYSKIEESIQEGRRQKK